MKNEMSEVSLAPVRQSSEVELFEKFFLQHYRRVYELLFRLTGQQMEAEDLTVDTFLRYLQRPPSSQEHHAGWLCRVAMRLGYNALRAAKRRTLYEEKASLYIAGGREFPDPLNDVERARNQEIVRAILRKMSEREAKILILHHSGFTYREIADAVDVSPNSVRTLISRAHKEFERRYLRTTKL